MEDKDTAQVAKRIMDEKIFDTAAIAGTEAAEMYGLDIIKTNIQTIKDNETRFVVVSKSADNSITKELNKASLKF